MARGRTRKKKSGIERSGYVYVLTNRSMPGMVKIGFTSRSAGIRANELSGATGVPTDFKIVFQTRARDAKALEAAVHKRLRSVRVKLGREFFRVSPRRARKEIVKEMRHQRSFLRAYWALHLVMVLVAATAGVAFWMWLSGPDFLSNPFLHDTWADLSVWIGRFAQK